MTETRPRHKAVTRREALAGRAEADEPRPVRPLLSLIVPTRNEAGNIEELLGRVEAATAGIATEIIFVDDSTDDTPNVIREVSPRCASPVAVIHRPPQDRDGLGGAVTRGMRAARGEWICVMDSDLQHPPELVRKLLARAEGDECDIVVASRYIEGGSASGLGSPLRKAISIASAWLSRGLFSERLWAVSDPCAGFFLVRRSLLTGVELKPVGFKILLEVLMRTPWRRVEEVPYAFEGRAGGESKATMAQGRAFLRHLAKLWFEVPGAGRVWKFALVGASGVAVNLGVLWALAIELEWSRWPAWAVALESSILWNFLLNRTFTWADRGAVEGVATHRLALARDFASYHAVAATAMAANASVFALMSILADAHVLVAGGVAVLAGMLINFVGADRFVFKLVPIVERRGDADVALEEAAE